MPEINVTNRASSYPEWPDGAREVIGSLVTEMVAGNTNDAGTKWDTLRLVFS